MNSIFLSYQNSSRYFLENIKETEVVSGNDYFRQLPSTTVYDYTLFKNSIVTELSSEQGDFRFFELPMHGTGFLTKVGCINQLDTTNIHPLHLELYQWFGSVIDSYSASSKELLPYNNVFLINNTIFGLGALEEDYINKCQDSRTSPNSKLLALTTIATESNGNLVQYDKDDKVYFYLADHIANQAGLAKAQDVPDDTFYTVSGVSSVKDWVDSYFGQFI
ncbi:hypothetical protein ACTXGK_03420 [Psychrobacter sp. T6-5]|uniref:hypothetical protein n=1 Tax=Psychrobacter sp. T6-5 TaxID=3457451 RepID=UPI003FD1CA55